MISLTSDPPISPPSVTILVLLLAALSYYFYRDYYAYLSLGPGGTPATPTGYMRVKLLSFFALRNPYTYPNVPSHFRPHTGFLSPTSVPPRQGPRPSVAGIAPQRQIDQKVTLDPPNPLYARLSLRLQELAVRSKNRIKTGTSCFEKHGMGLFSTAPITRTCGGEICHLHPSDGSMHMCLHPADIKLVVERGWGQRHPLARGGVFRRFVPKEFVMVYAPRDESDVETLVHIVMAAVWWVSGINIGCPECDQLDRGNVPVKEGDGHAPCWSSTRKTIEKADNVLASDCEIS